MVHRVFRREFTLAPKLVGGVGPGDTKRAQVVAGRLRDIYLGLHHRHTAEDELLWPLPLARVDLDADKVLLMEAATPTPAGCGISGSRDLSVNGSGPGASRPARSRWSAGS